MTGPLSAAAEEALVRLFDQTSLSFHVMDREGRILHANAKFRSYLGLTEEDVRFVGFERLRHDLPPAEARAWFLRALDQAADQAEMATWLRRDGVVAPVWVTIAGRRTEAGERLFIWGRDRSEEQLVTDRLMESADLQRHLAEGIYALSLTRTQEEAYQVLMGRASAILPGQHWFLGRVELEEGQRVVRLAAWIPDLENRLGPAIHGLNIPIQDSGFAREVYDLRRLCFVQDALASPTMIHPSIAKAYALRSLLGVPLVFEGQLTGVLFAASFQDEPAMAPRESQFSILQSLARIAALALERIQAEGRLEKAAGLARSLAAAVKDLAAATSEDALVAVLFRWAARLAPLPEWWFNRYDPVALGSITTHWTPGLDAFGTPEEIRRPVYLQESPMLTGMHLHQRAVLIPRCEGHPDLPGQDQWAFRTFVGLPLIHEGAVVGTLSGGSLGDQGHVHVSEDQFKALESLAEAAGLVLNRLHTRRALEEEEARFRLLFEQAPDPIVLISDEVVLDANAAAADLFGMDRAAMFGLPIPALNPERQPDGELSVLGYAEHLKAALSGQPERFEWTLLCAQGREAICQVNLTRLDHGDQPLVHMIVRDLTAQKRAEVERATLERQLFQAQKMESLGVLAGGIAHDFNNLLMGVLGHAGLALEQLNPLHPARRNLESIQKAGQRAADLTRQMLAYSGRGQFVIRNLDLTIQVQEMVHLLEVSIPKNVVLHLDLHRELPSVSVDASQIQQVIMNLVINAAEAIGEASGAITLATGAQRLDEGAMGKMLVGQDAAPGTYVYLEVTDTGCGMDEDTLGRIFEPFFTTKFTGRGLGLSAIMGIVRGHKGALRVYSEVGRGTTFKVLFPADRSRPEALAEEGENRPWSGIGVILVVDDDETVRAVARQALELKGFQVLEAEDGRRAVELVREHGPRVGVVLLDMTMPHMDGEAAYREMRHLQPDLRVILSSGYNELEAMGRFMGKGLKGFIQKPYGPRDLLAKIQEVLEG
ncbi:MAG: signal transduction histidine kinase, nitrogen specific, NtrB [Holophagaceae bacterium]|nr:signal transduction histidine kinase, nitrogen specific, NtrB [Holophagaceae bacterium]